MKKNIGPAERVARALAAAGMLAGALGAPLPLAVRVAALAVPAIYVALTALSGTCLGYRLLGRSTCPAPRS